MLALAAASRGADALTGAPGHQADPDRDDRSRGSAITPTNEAHQRFSPLRSRATNGPERQSDRLSSSGGANELVWQTNRRRRPTRRGPSASWSAVRQLILGRSAVAHLAAMRPPANLGPRAPQLWAATNYWFREDVVARTRRPTTRHPDTDPLAAAAMEALSVTTDARPSMPVVSERKPGRTTWLRPASPNTECLVEVVAAALPPRTSTAKAASTTSKTGTDIRFVVG